MILDNNFEKAEKIYFHDKILEKILLWVIPTWIKPNHITMARFIVTPLVAVLMLYDNYSTALITFLLVAFTDAIDGSLARTRNQVTEWGKIYDPLADKILISSAIFIIVLRYIDIWTSLLIITIEAIIVIVAWFRKRNGYLVQANLWGKIKMCLQVLGVAILLVSIINDWAALLPFASGTLYMAIVFAIISLFTYGI